MFKIFYNNVDISTVASLFEFKDFSFPNDDYVYFGHTKKPINSIFINASKINSTATLELQYYDGSTWIDLSNDDLTEGLSQPGLITWTATKNMKPSVQSGVTAYFFRVKDSSALPKTIRGINCLFSTDRDLEREFPSIMRYLNDDNGINTFCMFHESSRDDIITDLRNTGKYIKNSYLSNEQRKQLDYWDLLDISEVKQASTYLTLSKIFNHLSDEAGDRWSELSSNYRSDAGHSLTPLITIDENQDGIKDDDDLVSNTVFVGRL